MRDLDLSGDNLKRRWEAMHRGNREPFPEDKQLQEAWRQYHLGNFARAADIGESIGGAGLVPAAFATTIYAQYVEKDPERKPALFKEAMALCRRAEEAGVSTPNLHYMHAVSMGRYSQFISMIEALAQGFGGKIKEQVEKCLELDPDHAEGHVTFGGWHAAITDQAGGLMAKMLYGATQDGAQEHYEEAVRLAPDSPVVHLEYARGLEVMYGDSEKQQILAELEKALALTPADAMQRLDLLEGRSQLARLQR
jgi:tetratricopeptide (TPR) repeat protein